MVVDKKQLYDATVALSVKLAAAEPGSFLSEQISYLIPILDQINVELMVRGECTILAEGGKSDNT